MNVKVKGYLTAHAFYLVLIGVMGMAAWSWLQEHDARLLAELKVKDAQARIEQIQKEAVARVAVVRKAAAGVKTPQEAVLAIPDLSTLPLNATPLIGAPDAVSVDFKPLVAELSECKVARIELGACQEVAAQKDVQIAALGKRKGFWKRLGGRMKDVGIGVGIGLGIAAAGGHL